MEVQITIDDSKAFTRPWTVTNSSTAARHRAVIEFILQREQSRSGAPAGASLRG